MAKPKNNSRSDWLRVFIVFGVWKIIVFLIGYFAVYKFGLGISDAWERVGIASIFQYTAHFDSSWYSSIASHGYTYNLSTPAFYPLFPLLIAVVSKLGLSHITSAYMINIIAGFFAFYYLYKLGLDFFSQDKSKAMMTLLVFAFFPATFFLDVMYSEALFCALSFAAIYYARQHKWVIANIIVLFATATRLPGLIIAGVVLVEYLSTISWDYKRLTRAAWSFALAPLGFLAYVLYAQLQLGNAFAMFSAYRHGEWSYQKFNANIAWNITSHIGNIFWQVIQRPRGWQVSVFDMSGFLAWLGAIGATVYAWRKKFPVSYIFLLITSLVLFAINSNFVSSLRYLVPLFPIYFVVVMLFENKRDYFGLYLACSAMFAGIMLAAFASGIWVA